MEMSKAHAELLARYEAAVLDAMQKGERLLAVAGDGPAAILAASDAVTRSAQLRDDLGRQLERLQGRAHER